MKTKETNKQKKTEKMAEKAGQRTRDAKYLKNRQKLEKKKKTIGTRHSKRFPSITVAERSVSFHLENH